MWRGRSDDDDKKTQGRGGPGQSKSRGNSRQPQRSSGRSERSQGNPRGSGAGKKIRRIESGSTGRSADSGPRRRPTGQGGQPPSGRPQARGPADPTDIGNPPSEPPGRHQAGRGPAAPGGPGGLGLPPLTQPTGEVPKVPSDVSPDQTVVVSGVAPSDGVFSSPTPPEGFGDQMPSALPPLDDPGRPIGEATGVMPSLAATESDVSQTVAGQSIGRFEADLASPQNDQSATDPFPGGRDYPAADDFGAPSDFESPSAPKTRSFQAAAPATAAIPTARRELAEDQGAPRGSSRAARQPAPQDARGDARTRAAATGRPKREFDTDPRDRLQDTEFKLADKRRKQKPKEPNKLLLGVALAMVVLVGVAVAWVLSQDDSAPSDETAAEQTDQDQAGDAAVLEDAAPPQVTAPPEPEVDEPTLFFDDADVGPLVAGEKYSINLVGEPEGSMLQVVVDELPQGNPAAVVPDLILPEGRHTIYVQITNGGDSTASTPVEVYVLGEPPVQGYRANLASVDKVTEGWAEAVNRFDGFAAAGHQGLQLYPISDGYWNIFVGGLGEERSAANAYCESFGLEVPNQCFGAYLDPADLPASAVPEAAGDSNDATTDTSGG